MDIKHRATARFDAIADELGVLSRWLYDNPETGHQEFESSARLAQFLGYHGFAVEHPAYGLATAFAARAGSGGPEVIIKPGTAVNHQKEFAAHTVTPEGERAIRDGALGMAHTIIDLAEGDRWADLRVSSAPEQVS